MRICDRCGLKEQLSGTTVSTAKITITNNNSDPRMESIDLCTHCFNWVSKVALPRIKENLLNNPDQSTFVIIRG